MQTLTLSYLQHQNKLTEYLVHMHINTVIMCLCKTPMIWFELASFYFNTKITLTRHGHGPALMQNKSLTKWMMWVSDRKRAVEVREDEAMWALQLTARACTQVLIDTANNEHSILLMLTINARDTIFLSGSSTMSSVTSFGTISQISQQLPFFSLTCTTFSGPTLYFFNSPVLIPALKPPLQRENNGSARHAEPKAQVFTVI